MTDECPATSLAVVPKIADAEIVSATDEAHARHARILDKVREVSSLAQQHLELAALLREMQETKGYRELDFNTWEEYLRSLGLGRTFLSLLLKLGRAGDLDRFVDQGMGASMIIEYAKHVGVPQKIPAAIEATFQKVVNLPVREASKEIAMFVAEHAEDFKRPRKTRTPSVSDSAPTSRTQPVVPGAHTETPSLKKRLLTEYMDLPPLDRTAFVTTLKEVLEELEDRC